MNTADLITSFFNNEMSPEQERQFLVSVASSDSLRLGLKSHVMLDKILHDESDATRVSPRTRVAIMREAAIVAAAAGALSSDEAYAESNEGHAVDATGAATQPGDAVGTGRPLGRLSRWASVALTLLLGVGSFFAGFYTGTETHDSPAAVSGIGTDGGNVQSQDRHALTPPVVGMERSGVVSEGNTAAPVTEVSETTTPARSEASTETMRNGNGTQVASEETKGQRAGQPASEPASVENASSPVGGGSVGTNGLTKTQVDGGNHNKPKQ